MQANLIRGSLTMNHKEIYMMIRFSIRKSILSLAVCSAMLCANHVAQAQYGNTQPVPQGAFQVCLDSSYCSYNNGGDNSDGTYPGSFTVATGATVTGSASELRKQQIGRAHV